MTVPGVVILGFDGRLPGRVRGIVMIGMRHDFLVRASVRHGDHRASAESAGSADRSRKAHEPRARHAHKV
jgi:hypothetical protein